MMSTRTNLVIAASALALAACGQGETVQSEAAESAQPSAEAAEPSAEAGAAAVTQERLLNAAAEPSQWLSHNRDYNETNYTPLTQITEENLDELGVAWFADLPTNQNVESKPLYVDGVLYLSLPWSEVQAFDARTGETLWHYDPEVPGEWNVNVCCGLDNRGVAAWEGKIYVGTLDGRVIAIDAATGEEVWDTSIIDREWPYSITGAPRVANGKVYIGTNGGEFGVRGSISALDAETGEELWRFYTVPGNPADGFENEAMEMAAETWGTPGWWEVGGGGPVWDAITYDTENNSIIFGVGNGTPWSAVYRDPSGGDNLFLASIVAVDADTGEYKWHYQAVPWETWDYDTVQQLTIANVEIDGEMRRVVMQASKGGIFYVLDAATGQFIQAAPFTVVNWVDGFDPETGRPNIVPDARYDVEDHTWTQAPGPAGAHAWTSMAYSPDTGLVYVPTHETYGAFSKAPDYTPNPGGMNLGTAFGGGEPVNPETGGPTVGRLIAWDPVEMREVWRSPDLPGFNDINHNGVRDDGEAGIGGIQITGGAMATATNLVFQPDPGNRQLHAYRASDGERLWTHDLGALGMPGPISYELDGEQYIAIAVGGPVQGGYYAPNGARLLAFKLGGTAVVPELPAYEQPGFVEVAQFGTDEDIAHGGELFAANCALCHGQGGNARATFPDLRRTIRITNQAVFDSVVLGGALEANGMASFADQLTEEDSADIRAYLVAQAEAARNAPQFGGFGGPPPAAADEEEEEAEIHEDPNE